MLYCQNCDKKVVIYGVSYGAASDDDLEDLQQKFEDEGILILFNPPPFHPYHCPRCGNELITKDE